MKTIRLPADVEHLYLDEVAHLIADYFNPEGPNDPDGVRYKLDRIQAENEVHQAAKDDSLSVKHPGTHGPFPLELGLKRAVVLVPDMVAYLAARGIAVVIAAPATDTATPAPVGADGVSDTPAPAPVADWRNAVRAEAWEKWVKIRAENGTPTLENVSTYLARWCDENEVKTDTGKVPRASYLKIHVIDGKHWGPPRNMSRETAKKHLEQKEHAKRAI